MMRQNYITLPFCAILSASKRKNCLLNRRKPTWKHLKIKFSAQKT